MKYSYAIATITSPTIVIWRSIGHLIQGFPNFDQNSDFWQKTVLETRPNLGPTDVISKKPTYDCSSAMNDEVSGEKVQLLLKMAVPRHFC